MSIEDFTMYGGAFGNKQDSVFPNLEVRWCHQVIEYILSPITLLICEVPIWNKHDRKPTRVLHLTVNLLKTTRSSLYILLSCIFTLSKMFPIMSEPEKSIILLKVIMCFIWSSVDDNKHKTCNPSVICMSLTDVLSLVSHRALWCPRPPLWCCLLCPGRPPMQWLVSCRTN